jgi:CheY-like chemotaxis protein
MTTPEPNPLSVSQTSDERKMSKLSPGQKGTHGATARFGPDGRDRRRRRRVKLAMPVHIWGGVGSADEFEDVGKTIDASRDGLLVLTARGTYWPGQLLQVSLGGGADPGLVETAQRARVIRSAIMPDHFSYTVAIEFQKVGGIISKGQLVSACVPMNGGVLIVESDPRIASLTRNLLQEDGYQVVHAASGAEALEILLTATPDVLLAAMEGDEISGHDLCSIIKQSSRLQHIPVILLTNSGQPADYSACHRVGAVLCLSAPYSPTKLQRAVRLVAPPRGSDVSYSELRKIPRYTFAATTEMTDRDGVRLLGRVAEISRRGCYVDALNTLPVGTIRRMQIVRDSGTFIADGKVIYVHARIGMGVVFIDPLPDQLDVLDFWLAEFAAASE